MKENVSLYVMSSQKQNALGLNSRKLIYPLKTLFLDSKTFYTMDI